MNTGNWMMRSQKLDGNSRRVLYRKVNRIRKVTKKLEKLTGMRCVFVPINQPKNELGVA